MSSAWSKVFRGIAQAAEGLADLSDGSAAAGEGAAGVQTSTGPAELKGLLSALAQQLAGGRGQVIPPGESRDGVMNLSDEPVYTGDTVPLDEEVDLGLSAGMAAGELPPQPWEGEQPDAPLGAPPAPPDDSVVPKAENGIPLLPCPELDRQHKERRRRAKFRQDPVQALSAASYWLAHLSEQPLRAEEWTRCVECLPGTASERFNNALRLGMSELQLYATYYDECMAALQAGKDKAEQMARFASDIGNSVNDPREAIDTTDLLDADRIGRVLFWLGDRPDVEALTDAPPATADVRLMGPDHIDGPRGTVQTSAQAGEELLTLEELEAAAAAEGADG